MDGIKVSIIIPVYNVEKYLKRCIDSALNQTLSKIEIIVVNDGSPDSCLAILNEYQTRNDNLKVISQVNQGLGSARNIGIAHAKGEFLAFLDGDDYIDKHMLKSMYRKACIDSSDIVVCRFRQVGKGGGGKLNSNTTVNYSKEDSFENVLAAKSSSMACDKIVKRELFIGNNIKYPLGLYHEDVAVTYQLFYFARKISLVENTFYNWLWREDSISRSVSLKHANDFFEIFDLTYLFLKKQNVYEKYKKEFLRRVFHFSMDLVDRVFRYDKGKLAKSQLIKIIIFKLEGKGYTSNSNLNILCQYDRALYDKYLNVVKVKAMYLDNRTDNLEEEVEVYKVFLMQKELELISIYDSIWYKLLLKLNNICLLVLPTNSRRQKFVKCFLLKAFGISMLIISLLSPVLFVIVPN